MSDKLSKRVYHCKCGTKLEEYVWESQLYSSKFKCSSCSGELAYKNIKVKKHEYLTSIRTPTKNR